jgi:hypothetical protein
MGATQIASNLAKASRSDRMKPRRFQAGCHARKKRLILSGNEQIPEHQARYVLRGPRINCTPQTVEYLNDSRHVSQVDHRTD